MKRLSNIERYFQNLTPSEKAIQVHDGGKARWANMTEKQKEAQLKRMREARKYPYNKPLN